ncbi:uncharacterized protein BBA_08668 [Beauveria bassiana ARSEF 2860]|uniref:Uncharacterized protein n=1 Tax=Beauveria bassiana (strain ARSEF 2860) TaxID=655819 RepID=J4UH17_BEAB2|nr:uncharacterized protein BBA_08668 [Beauveria bassiana ARSEF 2860]EJP62342.1 hypothetical protein BBA_08668 [Beauveria bassiana ARSEF 2860]
MSYFSSLYYSASLDLLVIYIVVEFLLIIPRFLRPKRAYRGVKIYLTNSSLSYKKEFFTTLIVTSRRINKYISFYKYKTISSIIILTYFIKL